MKTLSWCLNACYIAGFCLFCYSVSSANAQFPPYPKQRPASAPQNTQTQVSAPPVSQVQAAPPTINVAPPTVNVAPPTVNVSSPAVNVSPQLVAPTPSTMDEIKSWLNTIFGGLIAALLAKIGFKPAAPPVVVAGNAGSEPASILLALRDKATDPDTRARIDQTLIAVLGTGIPSKLAQTGLSMVPGVGPVLSGVEPILHNAFMGFLKDRLEGNKQ